MKQTLFIFCLLAVSCFVHAQNIIQAEYFFDDNDAGFGSCNPISLVASGDSTWQFAPGLSVAGLTVGHHKLYIRTKDDNNQWSHTIRRNVDVLTTFAKDSVIAGEWFVDDGDLGYGGCNVFTITSPDSVITETYSVQASSLAGMSYGHHKVYSRVLNTNQKWSHTIRRNFDLLKSAGNKDVVEVEYFFTVDLGFSSCYNLPLVPSTDSTWVFNIPVNQIPVLNVDTTFYLRVRDSLNGEWSHTVRKRETFSFSSGINETMSGNGYSISPNPASDRINVSILNLYEPVLFTLLNSLGEKVRSEILSEQNTAIQLNQLADGIYFVNLRTSNVYVTRKILIQNK
jgi:hypothetical protein